MDSRFRGKDGVTGLLPVARGLAPRSSVRHRNSGACPPLVSAPPSRGGLSHARLCSAVARGLPPAPLCSAVARGLVPRSSVLRRCAGLVPRPSVLRRCSGACPTPACASPLLGGLSHALLCSAVARGLVLHSSLLRRSAGACPPLPAPDQTLSRTRSPAFRNCQATGLFKASQTSNTPAWVHWQRVPWASAFRFRYRCGT